MAKAKFDFQKFMVERGEKVGIGVAAALMALLLFLGIKSALASPSSSRTSEEMTKQAADIKRRVASPEGTAPALPEWVLKPSKVEVVAAERYHTPNDLFDPIGLASAKRGQPRIVGPAEFQVDLVRAQVAAIEMIKEGDRILVGVRITQEKSDNKAFKMLGKRKPRGQQQPPAMPGGPG